MKIEKLRPIPKYIVERIKKKDRELHPAQDGLTRFYSYLAKNDGDLKTAVSRMIRPVGFGESAFTREIEDQIGHGVQCVPGGHHQAYRNHRSRLRPP